MSELATVSLVTIVAETALKTRLAKDLKGLGVSGYTVTAANGEGSRNSRAGDVDGGNVLIQCLVSRDLSVAIMNHLEADYFENYAVVAWVSAAEVIRKERYS
jgi:nitrogen regulatory protein P-II 2